MLLDFREQTSYSSSFNVNGLLAETHVTERLGSGVLPDYALGRAGQSIRLEVHQGDRAVFDTSGTQDRVELSFPDNLIDRNVQSYHSQQINVLPGSLSTASFCSLMQWHNTPDAGEISPSPPLALYLNTADHLYIVTRGSSQNPLLSNPAGTTRWTSAAPIVRGRPINTQWEIKFDYAGTASLKVTVDGAVVVDLTNIVMGFDDLLGNYFKTGVYRATSPETMAVVMSNIEMGTSTLSGRTSNPPAIPT